MEAIFHEQQEGSLCAQHCLNSLLQGQFYSAIDLGELAAELDTMERRRMAEMGEDSAEYRAFIAQPSANMDDSGFFSVQVISRALTVWGLDLVPRDSSDPAAVRAKASPIAANAYICNYREHWFAIRRLGNQWFNLNSLLEGPELVSNSYLGEFLAQLQQEGYSIFLVTGTLPECDADLVLQAVPAVQSAPPRLLSDVNSSGSAGSTARAQAGRAPPPIPGMRGQSSAQEDEAAELEAAMMMSLAETSGSGGAAAQLDSETLDQVMAMQRTGNMNQEEELEMALRLSQQQHQQPAPVPEVSEEDEIQKAIALSLEGGAGLGLGGVSSGGGAESGGWGGRLAEQEREEEQRYKEEAEKAVREEEEQLRQALAMSMDMETGSAAPKSTSASAAKGTVPTVQTSPSSLTAAKPKTAKPTEASRVDPVQAGWHKPKNPAPGSIASAAPAAAGPSGLQQAPSPTSPKAPQETTSPTKTAPAALAMPEGPGHTLGGASTAARGARPGRGAEKAQDDPQEIRRRRLAFLDKMAKEQKEKEQEK